MTSHDGELLQDMRQVAPELRSPNSQQSTEYPPVLATAWYWYYSSLNSIRGALETGKL
jgi:hypothetical protein